jgi:Leucine-rich repeat (LRR) protein
MAGPYASPTARKHIDEVIANDPLCKSISLINSDIVNLNFLSNNTYLENLYIGGGYSPPLASFDGDTLLQPLKTNRTIYSLYLNACMIDSVSFAEHNTTLTVLHLNMNRIENIHSLRWCINLTDLELVSNRIVDIEPLKYLSNLTSINLSQNKIKDASVLKSTNLPFLYYVNIGSNKIRNIDFMRGNETINYFFFHTNRVKDIEPLLGNSTLVSIGSFESSIRLNRNPIENMPMLTYIQSCISYNFPNKTIRDRSYHDLLLNLLIPEEYE